MDLLNVVIRADTSGSDRATQSLGQMTGAAREADAAVRSVGTGSAIASGSLGQSALATDRATASSRAHAAALHAEAAAAKMAGFQRRNLAYQMFDVSQTLALGMNPLMVLMQQGPQIAQIYGPDEGGLGRAFSESAKMIGGFLGRIAPVGVALGVVAGGIAGIAYEINKTAEVQVGFFDVALAGWQLFAEGVASLVAPVFGAIGSWLQQGWDAAAPILKSAGNMIIGTFVGAYDAVMATWTMLPSALGDVVYSAAAKAVEGVVYMVNETIVTIQTMISQINQTLSSVGLPGLAKPELISQPEARNPYAGASSATGAAASEAFGNAMSRDYMGGAFDALSERAQAIAAAKGEVEALGGAAGAANDNVKKLADDGMSALEEKAFQVAEGLRSAFQGIGSGIFDAIKKGGDIAGNVLDMLMDKLGQFASSWLDNIINNGIDAFFGGGFGGFGMSSGMAGTSSITGSSGGYFPGFDGGGYTGNGGRYGGLDGKGGFLAMMHPQESVIDHTKPQAANQNQRPQVSINIINNAGVEVTTSTVEDGQGGIRQDVVLNRAVAGAISNPGPANTAARTVGKRVRR